MEGCLMNKVEMWVKIFQDIEDINQAKLDEIEKGIKDFNESKKGGGEVVYLKTRINGVKTVRASWKQ